MVLTLFDYEVEPVSYTEKEINEAFHLLLQRLKEKGNKTSICLVETNDIKKYFDEFSARGWLEGIYVPMSLLDYHTVEEVLERIEEYVDQLLQKDHDSIDFNTDTWRVWGGLIPFNMAADFEISRKLRSEVFKNVDKFSKRIAIELGLSHLLNTEERLKEKNMYLFTHKGYKKRLIPYLESELVHITNFDEMKEFFSSYFLVGRLDEFIESKEIQIPPYPNYECLSVTDLHIAALCEADESNIKAVLKIVLSQIGKSSNNYPEKVRYMPNFTYDDYLDTFDEADIALIIDDTLRLKRLKEI